jgi:ribosomal protein L22
MKYWFTCQPDGTVLSTEASNDEEAMAKLLTISAKHMKEFHKDMPPMSDKEAKKMIKSVWKKK